MAAHAVAALENGRLVDHITHQANHDQLTGLANRTVLARRLAGAQESEGPTALFYVDLDGFKPINDRYGHDVGDGVLRVAAQRLLEHVRANDTVARMGGDEFVVLVEDIESAEQVEQITARLEQAFIAPLAVGRHTFAVGASIGRAVWPADVANHHDLLVHADAAMYRAKRAKLAA